jgi:hypothetical protein
MTRQFRPGRLRIFLIFLTAMQALAGSAQQISKTEYFIDTDPGFGNGVAVPLTPAADLTNISFNVPVTGLTPGFHTLFVRSQDELGHWSHTPAKGFYKNGTGPEIADPASILAGEYFVDIDPGFGSGTPLSLTPGTDISSLLFSLDLGSVSRGSHQLFVRFKDSRGNWGQTTARSFFHDQLQTSDTTRALLVAGEYFFDIDPGFGKGIRIPVNGSQDDALSLSADINGLSPGFHQLFVRFLDSKNNWSLASARSVFREDTDGSVRWYKGNILWIQTPGLEQEQP